MNNATPSFLQAPPSKHTTLIILVALAWAALPMMFSLPLPITVLFVTLMGIRGILLHLHIGKLPPLILMPLALLAAALVWNQLGTLLGREGGIAFLLIMITLKAFESSSRRDWNVLLLAMLFLIGSSVLLNQSLLIGAWLMLALPIVALCFATLSELSLNTSLRQSLNTLLLTLPLTAVLFIGIPRLNEPLWRIPQTTQNQAKTGLSNTMQPGSISNLVQSDEWVANIVFSDGLKPKTKDLYWRAIIMDEFDGTRWQAASEFNEDRAQTAKGQIVSYQMIIRDQNGALPTLDQPIGQLPRGLVQRMGNIVRADLSREGLRRLNLQAALSDTLPHALNQQEYRHYTRLPNANPQTLNLSKTLASQSKNERDFIQRSLNYFTQQHFSYSLQPPLATGKDSVDQFMFESKQGFCEHYAQSFTVMMRAAGLPARIVTGYLGAEYNPQGNFWQIRSKDAHAWAEVWLPREQVWLRVDPTAAVSSNRVEQGISQALPKNEQQLIANPNILGQWRDISQFYWQQWVVNYDQNRQNNLFAKLGLGGFNLKTLLLVLPLGLLFALLPLWRWWANRLLRDDLQQGFMLLKRAVLNGHDEQHLQTITANELKNILKENNVNDTELTTLLTHYETIRYAGENNCNRTTEKKWYRMAKKTARRYR